MPCLACRRADTSQHVGPVDTDADLRCRALIVRGRGDAAAERSWPTFFADFIHVRDVVLQVCSLRMWQMN